MSTSAPPSGRGAPANPAGRFESTQTLAFDDGWGSLDALAEPQRLDTTVAADPSRSVLSENQSPDVPFRYSINAYRGCEHGCIYCYARPSHEYLNLSAGLDFETKLFYKADAAAQFEAALRRPGYQCEVISLGANTDPYQPIERQYRVVRQLLEVAQAYRQPISIVTKGTGVLRDVDLLSQLAERNLAQVFVSITSLDPELKRRLEPRAAAPAARLRVIRELSDAGIPTGCLVAPIIPGLTDADLEKILQAVAEAGALSAHWILLRLPGAVQELFEQWLQAHYPQRAAKVLSLLKQCHNGQIREARFGHRMRGQGPVADLIAQRFDRARQRLGLDQREKLALDTRQFRPPPRRGDQLSLI